MALLKFGWTRSTSESFFLIPPAGNRQHRQLPASGGDGDDVLDSTVKAPNDPLPSLRLGWCGQGPETVRALSPQSPSRLSARLPSAPPDHPSPWQ